MRNKAKFVAIALAATLPLGGAGPAYARSGEAEIRWDEWDVAHVTAPDDVAAMRALGWVQMQAHGNLLLSLYARARGQAAEYWGESWAASDIRLLMAGIPDAGRNWAKRLTPAERARIVAFIDGANAYAARHPDRIATENKPILPLRISDPLMHVLHVVVGTYVAGAQVQKALTMPAIAKPDDPKGSNAYAVAPSRSASGEAMLLINPHLPWGDLYTWFEAQISVPGSSYYGAAQVGSPFLGIAFNEQGGWTHTVNQFDGADLYQLTLDGDRYQIDGQWRDLESETRTIHIRGADGRLARRDITIQRSIHGPLIRREANHALALRLVGLDSYGLIQQYWDMAKADGVDAFEAATRRLQMPFFNTIYAGRKGDIYYLYGGRFPNRGQGDHAFWEGIIPGNRSSFLPDGFRPYEQVPHFRNPPGGFIQNANDPPWLTTLPQVLKPGDYAADIAPLPALDWRAQQSLRQIADRQKISFDDLVEMERSTHVESADRLLPDLLSAAATSSDPLITRAAKVLANWDRRGETESRGAILFGVWARKLLMREPGTIFATQWSPDRPLATPSGLADPDLALRLLTDAAREVEGRYQRLDVAYGKAVRLRLGPVDLPASGGDVYLGSYRASWHGKDTDGANRVQGGNTFTAIVSFGPRLRAVGLLPYGNATAPGFGGAATQLRLFSDNKLRPIHFYPDEVAQHTVRTETVPAGKGK